MGAVTMVSVIYYPKIDKVIPKIKGQWRRDGDKIICWFTEKQWQQVNRIVTALMQDLEENDGT